MSTELDQRRRNIAVMDLLTESFEAHTHGSDEAAKAAIERAAAIDGDALVVIQGGMVIGEVPNPERDWPGWVEYVEANRAALAALEGKETRTKGEQGPGV